MKSDLDETISVLSGVEFPKQDVKLLDTNSFKPVDGKFQCPYCLRLFKHKKSLMTHLLNESVCTTNTPEYQYTHFVQACTGRFLMIMHLKSTGYDLSESSCKLFIFKTIEISTRSYNLGNKLNPDRVFNLENIQDSLKIVKTELLDIYRKLDADKIIK